MKDPTKVQLSEVERELMQNSEWILTKNKILLQWKDQFASMISEREFIIEQSQLPDKIKQSSPKISRGENYQGLPWLVAHYPRVFEKENIFLIRTMFWWGHYFSTTLLVSGEYKQKWQQQIIAGLKFQQLWFNTSDDPWVHNLAQDHSNIHTSVEQSFIKCSDKIEFAPWDTLRVRIQASFNSILSLLKVSEVTHQDGEKDPSPGDPKEDFDP